MIRSLILVIFGGMLLILAVRRLKQFKLKERYTLLFLMLGLPFLALAIWPRGVEILARATHISEATVMLFGISVFLILIVFELLTIVSVQDPQDHHAGADGRDIDGEPEAGGSAASWDYAEG